MFVHRSNRTEKLADALAEVVRRPLASAMTPEIIVVASHGLERWLAQELAIRLGVWANARFPFPRSFADELLALGTEPSGASVAYRRENLVWSIAALLPDIAVRNGGEPVRSYLDGDTNGIRRFGLARQLAHVFDQYPVYRPELVRAWERGAGRGFQPELWRALVGRYGAVHVAARATAFLDRAVPDDAPERVSIFGISTLPPIYLRILAHLATTREVHLFQLCPSASDRERHRLAVSLGQVGYDFGQRLRGAVPAATFDDSFVVPGDDTLLTALQSDLSFGKTRAALRTKAGARPEPDTSVSIHSCHSPIREVEVLRDQLLAAFDADPSLEPHDVIVMTPDIDAYAPLIEAVFGRDTNEPGFVPFRISDRSTKFQNRTAQALLRLLALVKGRMKASEVLDLLQLDPVRARFDIESDDLPEVRRLVRESGIRWGIDAEHRDALGQPEQNDNTWEFGLSRLVLGSAMSGSSDALFAGVLPVGDLGGDLDELVGKLSEFASTLFSEARALEQPRTVDAWAVALQGTLDRFTSVADVHAAEHRATSQAIEALRRRAADGCFAGDVHLEALMTLLEEELDVERISRSFATGGVTFSALLPMRSVPFRVVGLLGLSDEDFPRKDRAAGFDLIARKPLPGDRSARDEDRQLFLEALLSARDRMILIYVGRAVHDNARFPPSVVVAELAETLESMRAQRDAEEPKKATKVAKSAASRAGQLAFSFAAGSSAPVASPSKPFVLEHPLQPWSPRYFGADQDPGLMSYVEADAEAARALVARDHERRPFQSAPLIGTGEEVVTVDELARFLENPSRALLQRRLGVNLDEEVLIVEDHDPMEVGPLEAYSMGSRLLAWAERGAPLEAITPWARATGLLPVGAPGDIDLAPIFDTARELAATIREWRDGGPLAPVEVEVGLEKSTLVGVLYDLYPKAQVLAQYARVKPKNELAAWVRHLAMAAVSSTSLPTVLIGRPIEGDAPLLVRLFDPVSGSDATRYLSTLLGFYRLGLMAPLCLFPKASRRFAELWNAGDAARDPLEAAKRTFLDDRKAPADADDSYVRRLFEGVDPFATSPVPFDDDGALGLPSFEDLSRGVFGPLLASSRVIST